MTDYVYSSIITDINQCPLMGLEKVINSRVMGEHRITISKDNFNQYRITLKHINSRTIISAILYDQFKTVRFKYTVPTSRGNGYTKQLHSYIQHIVKRKFRHSEHLTVDGVASI